ncbi:hypothetical protein N3K66_004261 [Trichothecium roseum]|uniref:Uncharacterized protein n=1 Tax=Trichothecium roseum TaxID=47278 RepID=A0ACC0V0R7_9HYPO|nr:hypothetical protein N3K66_004261 [Trichothecium roseum]
MSRGPVPTQLRLLSALPSTEPGAKVRFLGCVLDYAASAGRLTLGHRYPKDAEATVAVDVSLVLERMNHEMTRVGAWLNVLGYVTEAAAGRGPGDDTAASMARSSSRSRSGRKGKESRRLRVPDACVQALLVWPTGPLDVGRYEKILGEGEAVLGKVGEARGG